MEQKSLRTYLRRMALDSDVVRLELVSLMRYSGDSLNQMTRKVYETGRGYDADPETTAQRQETLLFMIH